MRIIAAIRYSLLVYFICLSIALKGQADITVQPVLNVQLWSAYTIDQKLYDDQQGAYIPVENRLNFQMHRSRIGLKGDVNKRLKYLFIGAADFVGRDLLSGTIGGNNNGANPSFRLWNAYVSYKALKDSDLLHVRFGYFVPEISRESITSPFRVNSFEKSWTQNYIRRHMTGTGPGRTNGINLGGMYHIQKGTLAISYDAGVFNPLFTDLSSNSSGVTSSNLLTYRLALHLGDPEGENYSVSKVSTYFGKRKGITLALSQAHQGSTEIWSQSDLIGLDILGNYGPVSLIAEWAHMTRSLENTTTSSDTWMVRMSYNIPIGTKNMDVAVSRMQFSGPMMQVAQEEALALHSLTGKDGYTELVFNYYATKQTKLSIAYTWRQGDAGFYDQPGHSNNFFDQPGVTSIQRGDYLAAGLIFNL